MLLGTALGHGVSSSRFIAFSTFADASSRYDPPGAFFNEYETHTQRTPNTHRAQKDRFP